MNAVFVLLYVASCELQTGQLCREERLARALEADNLVEYYACRCCCRSSVCVADLTTTQRIVVLCQYKGETTPLLAMLRGKYRFANIPCDQSSAKTLCMIVWHGPPVRERPAYPLLLPLCLTTRLFPHGPGIYHCSSSTAVFNEYR